LALAGAVLRFAGTLPGSGTPRCANGGMNEGSPQPGQSNLP